eukprot:3225961-Lingulodinium_polyedra.AAC.1
MKVATVHPSLYYGRFCLRWRSFEPQVWGHIRQNRRSPVGQSWTYFGFPETRGSQISLGNFI